MQTGADAIEQLKASGNYDSLERPDRWQQLLGT
jgi:hypothetical protein